MAWREIIYLFNARSKMIVAGSDAIVTAPVKFNFAAKRTAARGADSEFPRLREVWD
jgi:hypothetical protein